MAQNGYEKQLKGAVVKGADGSIVCVCHPANAKEMCGGADPVDDIFAYGRKCVEVKA